ncbi:MAG: imidazole glycerol phosphate synthase subunit HisF [Bacteroidetes bacterium HGW-Bacteroidetes-5]|jgi:cyclase|nr:MAG: imidazole glycerol phosphate synthase subunit HisF [Bacteroidetes bacterium HGW-Bacteroidetes-5]
MLYPRIIPCLLVHKKGLVKTTKFKDPKYVGDPINAVKIFNEKEVDELIVLDIDASREGREPDYKMIENLAIECRMPLCYGGGIKTVEQAQKIFNLGVEKIALSSAAVENPLIIKQLSEQVGNQSVVVVLDIKRKLFGGKYELFLQNGTKSTGLDPIAFAQKVQSLGAGEIVVNSIDYDGVMKGYDMDFISSIRDAVNIPLTVMGGAGTLDDIGNVIKQHGIIGVAAGSLFVFKGKFRAVLINYPTTREKSELLKTFFLINK